jgi:ornithine--oxo-acid transaminase
VVPYGDLDALCGAITPRTATVLVEPVQGEAGVLVPPPGYLAGVRAACDDAGVLLIVDESSPGWPVPGSYWRWITKGSGCVATWGTRIDLRGQPAGLRGRPRGNRATGHRRVPDPLAGLGAHLHARLSSLIDHGVAQVTGRGLWAGVHLAAGGPTGQMVTEALMAHRVLCKETHSTTVRITPPLVIARNDLDYGLDALTDVLIR